jgi:amino acid transporter
MNNNSNNKSNQPRVYRASQLDVYFLGLTIVIGGQIIFWNKGLKEGFWKFFSSMLLVGTGYLCLTLCLAEMTSMMPFAGGSFGYVRCTLGPVTGYLVGCCEAAEYILYVASAVVEIGRLLTVITQLSPSFEPLYWISFYAISLVIQMKGGRIFWGFNRIIAIITVLLILIFCLASLPHVNFSKFAVSSEDHNPGLSEPKHMFEEIFHFFPLVSWFYVGVESMTLSCGDIPQANRRVPWMMVCSMLTLLVTSSSIVLTTCSQYPGTLQLPYEDLPLSPGYSKIFNYASPRLLAIIAMPGTFSTSFGFMFAYGRQLKAMARSGLLPGYLGQEWGNESVPLTALLTGSIVGCSVLLFLWLLFPKALDRLFGLCMLSSCTVYVAIFASFLIARQRLDTVPRAFVSPFGRPGAYYGMTIFSIMAVTLSIFQYDNYVSLIVYLVAITGAVIHYALIARKREFLSLEEQAQFMKAYLLHSDAEYRRRMVRRSFANKHAFLRKVAPFAYPAQKRGGLGHHRWNRGTVTAPVELIDGLDDPTAAAGLATTPSPSSEHNAHQQQQHQHQQQQESDLLVLQQEQDSSLRPHQLHLQSSLLHSAAEISAQQRLKESQSQEYNANHHHMTLELEQKMRKLAEEIFAGQDEGHVTIVRSRHGRRALTFRWKESKNSAVSSGKHQGGNALNSSTTTANAGAREDGTEHRSTKQQEIRETTSSSASSTAPSAPSLASPLSSNPTMTMPTDNAESSSGANAPIVPTLPLELLSDRIIRLAETDTAVEIIPGLDEEVYSPNDAYTFYPTSPAQEGAPSPSAGEHGENREDVGDGDRPHHHVSHGIHSLLGSPHHAQSPAAAGTAKKSFGGGKTSSSVSSNNSSNGSDIDNTSSHNNSDDDAHHRVRHRK